MKKYIKLNNNDNHLSLGNFTRIIKENTINKTSAIQIEVFNALFNTNNINDTTVNNYCIGIRSINNEYKQQYIIYKKKRLYSFVVIYCYCIFTCVYYSFCYYASYNEISKKSWSC